MRFIIQLGFYLFILLPSVKSQNSNYHYKIEGQTILTTQGNVPFWMRSNQYGSIPLSGPSMSMIGAFSKDYDTTKRKLVDWGIGFEGRANAGSGSNLTLVEGYAKARFAMFELKAGRSKDVMGLVDTLLSSGAFSISGNALGIPQVQIGVPEFYTLPFFGGLFAFKGNLSHGWVGHVPISNRRVAKANTYFHQKSLYGRLGKPGGKLFLYGGYSDQAFWGNEEKIFESFTLSDWQSFGYLLLGKNWAQSKIGNHLGSVDLGLEIRTSSLKLLAYRQQIYDIGALYYLANVLDGLSGLSINRLKTTSDQLIRWQKIVVEVLSTTNQAGYESSRETPSGAENYYNHYLYSQGWSYNGYSLGNPLLTMRKEVRNQISERFQGETFVNNRVLALHIGMVGSVGPYHVQTLATYSRNYGTFGSSGLAYRLPFGRIAQSTESFGIIPQVSFNLTWEKPLHGSWYWGGAFSLDRGQLLPNSTGIIGKVGLHY